jgi:hypothetical protein
MRWREGKTMEIKKPDVLMEAYDEARSSGFFGAYSKFMGNIRDARFETQYHQKYDKIVLNLPIWPTIVIAVLILSILSVNIRKISQPAKSTFQNIDKDCPSSILIDALVSPDRATDMQANLAEVFPLWVKRYGLSAARWIRQMQIARLIIGEYWNKVLELIKAIKLAGS